ncbi:MAG TPA: hypothetical protein PK286_09600, partial [Devosia sp.]|nr:hypothetical protein [Devosia sp.]
MAQSGRTPAIFAAFAAAILFAPGSLLLAQTAPPPVIPAEPAMAPPAAATPGGESTQAAPDTAELEQQRLEELEKSMSISADRVAALKKEIADMQGDRARQNAALIAAAQRVKIAEEQVAAMETRLGDLIVAELEVRGRLESAGGTISGVLAALERISRNPPPALIVDPSDALGSARSAILISAIVPQLQEKADELMADLKQLSDIKAKALEEEAHLKANFAVLEEEQLRIATLISARKEGEDQAVAELGAQEAEAQALAEKASSLKQLIDEL